MRKNISAFSFFIAALISAVNIFKNPLVKRGLKYSLENIFWARADIDYVNLKIFDSNLTIRGVAVANKDKPMENLFEVGNFTVDFDLVQLLKGKFVMDLAQCSEITYGTPRKTSGALPESVLKAKKAKKKSRDEAFEKKKNELLDALARQAHAEVTQILGNYDPETFLEDALNALQTPAMKDEIISDMTRIYDSWEDEIKTTQSEIKSFSKDIKALTQIDFGKKRTPQEINALIQQFTSVIEKIEVMKDRAEEISDHFMTDSKSVQGLIGKFQTSVKHDADYIKGRVAAIKIPDIHDGQRFLSSCFDSMFATLLGKWYPVLQDGIEMAREFQHSGKALLPKPEEKSDKKLVVRAKGRDVTYSKDLPSFLMREIRLGGNSPDKKFAVEGTIKNICNDADLLNMPVTGDLVMTRGVYSEAVSFVGDFRTVPSSDILGIAFKGYSYPMKFEVPDMGDIKGIPSVSGDGVVSADIYCDKNGKIGTSAKIALSQATVKADKFSPDFIYDLYSRVLATIKETTFGVEFAYSKEDKLDFALTSDADRQIAKGLKSVMTKEVNSLKKKLQTEVDARLADIKQEFNKYADKYGIMKSDVLANVTDLRNFEAELKAKQSELEKQIKGKVEDELKSSIKKGLKSLF